MTNKYTIDFARNNAVSKKTTYLLRMLQLEAQGYADRAAVSTAIADLRRELDDPNAVVNVIATVETKG